MTNEVLPPPIETSEELQNQRFLIRLKAVENALRYDKLKTTEKLAFSLASNVELSEKRALG